MLIYVYTDGASRKNPGESASGYMLMDSGYRLLMKESFYNGIKTNNMAEYLAVIGALRKVQERYGLGNDLCMYSDSELIVNQLNGRFRVKDQDLKELHAEAKALLLKFRSCKLTSVPREDRYITMVDKELNDLLDRRG